ncbi:ATP-dependent nuclease [Myroides odoratimimus]|uniref:ATP-dependent nuclease n=1 Tax=Myroides odoratimimus TaxID=76832 RepID=UPI00257508B7|nr:AAA family ATPase [Myroides odoratimimus]MDM1454882.1 AAA family ATPase [Myroides odoratimimus]MDM1478604.1 AAA family ATPase [Myroides odoratimimus]MDM1490948.1 AAA family ATPase [Myroides odoratimimus]
MKITQITTQNFRLLDDITINIEDDITLIVGKNNSGKTSMFEVVNLFFNEKNRISFHDFSLNSHNNFIKCYNLYKNELLLATEDNQKEELENQLINDIPRIILSIQIEYDKMNDSLINISEFISDLDESKNEATLLFKYEPKDTIGLFRSFDNRVKTENSLIEWLNENILSHYKINVFGGENLIEDNIFNKIQSIINFETIQASRKLDDTKMDNNRSLALGFADYYKTINSENNDVENLKRTLLETSETLDSNYEKILETILNKLSLFGVDKDINIPEIILKSKFDAESIIKNNIKYFYKNGEIMLPENYNGLGYSNLIFLVLKIISFIETFKKNKASNITEILTILIEEPEAHLHPQMQQVFIEQIRGTIKQVLAVDNIQVQIIISTHSSHMIAEAGLNVQRSFERIRYFSKKKIAGETTIEVKDFNDFKHKETNKDTFRFLKQYLNLNKCDLFFADKVIMVEGITEKLLMPLFIKKVAPKLENEYVSIIEVGGSYTHKFKEFFKFLNTKVLIVTDIDSVDETDNKSCHVLKLNANTSNPTLSSWLPNKLKISELIELQEKEKLDDSKLIRVAYQIAEDPNEGLEKFVARSLENAIINRNRAFFRSTYKLLETDDTDIDVVKSFSYQKLKSIDDLIYLDTNKNQSDVDPSSTQKTNFTFDLMTFDEKSSKLQWYVPKYVKEGLEWLEKNDHLITEAAE